MVTVVTDVVYKVTTPARDGLADFYEPDQPLETGIIALHGGSWTVGSKVSWKGDARMAQERGLELTYRYSQFNDTLKVLPLFHPECDVCGG